MFYNYKPDHQHLMDFRSTTQNNSTFRSTTQNNSTFRSTTQNNSTFWSTTQNNSTFRSTTQNNSSLVRSKKKKILEINKKIFASLIKIKSQLRLHSKHKLITDIYIIDQGHWNLQIIDIKENLVNPLLKMNEAWMDECAARLQPLVDQSKTPTTLNFRNRKIPRCDLNNPSMSWGQKHLF